ncbi:MAG: hypothetical protein ACOYN6_06590 [Ignavibacteria bacterium]
MGIFNFLKPKPSKIDEMMHQLSNEMFPKGEKDINACVDELLFILNHYCPVRSQTKTVV